MAWLPHFLRFSAKFNTAADKLQLQVSVAVVVIVVDFIKDRQH
jgi:hypothetical protein